MSQYIVSARKYRPATFSTVVGQQALTTTLKNAIATGKLAHAYLFCGPRGVGKTTCARIFAKTVNCMHPNAQGEACGECESCKAFDEGRSYNIHELDAASNNSVEDIRSLIEQAMMPPQVGRYKVFIIDEVHMLSQAAFNAFLKTLEEPPAHALFVLATTEKHKILPTILSRCQTYDFNRMETTDIVNHLKHVAEAEGIGYEEEALGVIAVKADGGMRDAMSIFDQVASYSGGQITYKKVIEDLNVLDYDYYFGMTDALLKKDIPGALVLLNTVLSKGFGANHFVGGLASHFRDLLVSRDEQTLPLLEVASTVRERYKEQAARCKPQFLYRALRLCNDCDINYRTSNNKRLLVELTLIEVAQTGDDEGDGCGPRPTKKLKPLFNTTRPEAHGTIQQQAHPTQQKQPVSVVTPPSPVTAPGATKPNTPSETHKPAAPVTAETPAAYQGKGGTLRMKTVSVRLNRQAEETPAAEDKKQTAPESSKTEEEIRDFDDNSLAYHWRMYAAALPKEQSATAGRMKNMAPTVGQDWVVDVPIENEQVIAYMEPHRQPLTDYLRKNLHNGRITLNFRLTAATDPKRAFTRQEQLANMLQGSPALATLVKELKLELT